MVSMVLYLPQEDSKVVIPFLEFFVDEKRIFLTDKHEEYSLPVEAIAHVQQYVAQHAKRKTKKNWDACIVIDKKFEEMSNYFDRGSIVDHSLVRYLIEERVPAFLSEEVAQFETTDSPKILVNDTCFEDTYITFLKIMPDIWICCGFCKKGTYAPYYGEPISLTGGDKS